MLLQGHPPPLIVVVAASCAALGSALTYLYLSRATRRKIEDEALPYSLETKHSLPNVLYRNLASPVGFSRPDPYNPQGRTGYLSWDDYFMAVAFLSAERSKDPNKQVGACIVNKDKVILGIGYNGFPRGCADNKLPWAKKSRTEGILGTKYPYVVHAEANALLNTNSANVHNASIYVTMFPCNECAKLLIQAGIKEVIYHEDKFEGRVLPSVDSKEDESSQGLPDPCYVASKRMLTMAGVKLIQHKLEKTIVVPPVQHGQGCWTGCSAQQDGCSDLNPLDVAMVVAPSCSLPRKH